jgi:hypothetical protein
MVAPPIIGEDGPMSAPKRSIWYNASIILAVAIGLFAVTFLVQMEWYTDDIQVRAHWPERIDQSIESHVPLTVRGPSGEPVEGATVELGYVRSPSVERTIETAFGDVHPDMGYIGDRIAAFAHEDDAYEPLTSAETDDEGNASLVIPPAKTFHTGVDDAKLIVKVRDGFDRWVGFVVLPASSEPRVLLSTDRPLYQPGQDIRMRALVVDAASGRPIEAAGAKRGAAVEFTVHGPRENLLSREHALVSPAGVASHSFALSPDGQQGTYKLGVTYDDTTTTELVDVKPYEKPRFDVELTTDADAVEGLSSGGMLRGTVRADYFYGEPVAGASVDIKVRPGGPSPEQVDALATQTGRLDGAGRFDFAIALPSDPKPALLSGRLVLTAHVTDVSGRVRHAEQTVQQGAEHFQVEVVPVDGTRFRIDQTNLTRIVVRDQSGEPVSDLGVELRPLDRVLQPPAASRTDDRGTAIVDWVPRKPDWVTPGASTVHSADLLDLRSDVDIELRTGNAKPVWKTVRVALALPDAVIITPDNAAPVVGEEFAFELRLPAKALRGRHEASTTVVAIHEGLTVASTVVRYPPVLSDEEDQAIMEASGATTLGPDARGLTHLVALDGSSRPVGVAAVWVRQKEGSAVQVTPTDAPLRPGEPASVDLSFPPGDQASSSEDESAVTFGVWAVDEALYALKERTGLPFAVLARQNAETVAALGPLLAQLNADGEAGSVSAGQLTREASSFEVGTKVSLTSLNHQFEREAKHPWVPIWMVTMGLVMLAILAFETRRAWQLWDPSGLDLNFIAALVCVVVVAVAAVALLDAASYESRDSLAAVLSGALLLLLLAGIGEALFFARDLQLWKWALALGSCVGIGVVVEDVGNSPTQMLPDAVIWIGVLLAVGMLLVQFGIWMVTLWAQSRRVATVSMLMLTVLAFGAFIFATFGRTAERKFETADTSVKSFVTFGGPPGGSSAEGEMAMAEESAEESAAESADRPFDRAANSADTASHTPLRVRDYFPDTMIWRPEVPSDTNGRASVDFTLPDSIAAWRVEAVAHSSDGRFGEGQARIEVSQPFFVELDLPTQLTAGDKMQLPVTLVDARQNPEGTTQVEVSVETDGGLDVGESIAPVELEAGGRQVVLLPIEATSVGEASLEVRARLAGKSGATKESPGDAVRRKTRIVADGRERASTYSAKIGERFATLLSFPDDTIDGTASTRVDILSGPSAAALDGLDAMLRQPHGCFEQTTAIAFPNIMVLRTLDETKPSAWPDGAEAHERTRKRALELVSRSYQRILTFQGESGGFGLYPGKAPSVMLTAYGLLQLTEIQTVLDVDASPSMRAAARWLRRQQRGDGIWDFDRRATGSTSDVDAARATAHVVWAMSQTPSSIDDGSTLAKGVDALISRLKGDKIGDYERALAANALLAAGRRLDATSVMERLTKSVERHEEARFWKTDDATWTGGRDIYADITTSALAARAMARAEVHPSLTNGVIVFLAGARQSSGGWGTTEATVWALDAMASVPKGSNEPARLKLHANGEPAGQVRVIPGRGVPHTFRPDVVGHEQRIEIESDRNTSAMAQATARYSVPWDSPAAIVKEEPFAIDVLLASRTLDVGEPARIEVTVANTSGHDAAATLVQLPIPPGAYADDALLDAQLDSGAVDRVERTPTHLTVYLPELRAGAKSTLAYAVVPRTSGTYTLPPVIAYPYYNPKPEAQRAGGQLIVR